MRCHLGLLGWMESIWRGQERRRGHGCSGRSSSRSSSIMPGGCHDSLRLAFSADVVGRWFLACARPVQSNHPRCRTCSDQLPNYNHPKRASDTLAAVAAAPSHTAPIRPFRVLHDRRLGSLLSLYTAFVSTNDSNVTVYAVP